VFLKVTKDERSDDEDEDDVDEDAPKQVGQADKAQ
jgi:hypothetical protein